MASEERSMNPAPKRGAILKGIILPKHKRKEQKELQSIANVCEREFAQNALVAVGRSSATFSLDAANSFLNDAPHPTKNEAMAKVWPWLKVLKGKFRPKHTKEEQKELPLQQSIANVCERESAQNAPGASLSITPKNGTAHIALVKEPVALDHGAVIVGSSSSDAANDFLENASHPTKNETMAKLWAEVDINNAFLYEGSALYKDVNGKWAVIGPLCDEAAESTSVVQPVRQIATPL